MRTRGRTIAVVAAAVALLALPTSQPVAEATGTPSFTRIRVTVTSSSTWTTVSLLGIQLLDENTVSVAPGGDVAPSSRGFAFHTPTPTNGAVAVVDAVFEVAPTAKPALRVDKGDVGSVQVAIDRTNTSDVVVSTLDTGPGRLSTDYVQQPIDRAALVGESLTIAPVDARRLVLAFYYPWFRSGSFDSGIWYDRPSGPYATDDPTSVAAMVDQAQGAGVNGFVMSWDGSANDSARFDLLAATAAQRPGFTFSAHLELVDLEQQSGGVDLDAITSAAADALSRSTQPAYLKVGEQPVLFVFGAWTLQPAQWQTVMANLAASGYHPFVVGDGIDAGFGFDGFYQYNPNSKEPAALRTFDWTSARQLRIPHVLHPEIPQGLWAATVSPGETKVGGSTGGTYRSRDDGLRYDRTWNAALLSQPDWVLITSWNEWLETTQIEPSQQFGYRALNQTATWSTRFHS